MTYNKAAHDILASDDDGKNGSDSLASEYSLDSLLDKVELLGGGFWCGPDAETYTDDKAEDDTAPRTLRSFTAFIHILKGNIGPGILALPLNFLHVGTLAGCACMGVVICHGLIGMVLLLRIQRYVEARYSLTRPLSFEEIGSYLLGDAGKCAVQTSVCALQFGVCTVFISLISANTLQLIGQENVSRSVVVSMVAVVCGGLSLLPDLESLWSLQLFGNVVMLTTSGSILVAAVGCLISGPEHKPGPTPEGTLMTYMSFIAVCFYAFEGVALVLPIRNQLRPESAKSYKAILVSGMTLVATLFVTIGSFGGIAFPDNEKASITVYLASHYEKGSAASKYFVTLNGMVALAVLFTFPLQLAPAALVVDRMLELSSTFSRVAARLSAVVICTSLVLLIPTLEMLIDLIGAVATTSLASLPYVFHARLRLTYDRQLFFRDYLLLAVDSLAISLCALVAIAGVKNAVG